MQKLWTQPQTIALTLLALLVILGAVLSSSYSIPMDEPNLHQLALDTWEYLFNGAPWPESVAHRFHGPLVDFSIYLIQRLFQAGAISTLVNLRHFVTFLWFAGGVAAFYVLVKKITKNERLALIGSVFLVLSPRIFGHTFINSRDVPFMSLFTLAMLALWMLLDTSSALSASTSASLSASKRTWKMAVLFGVATGAAMAVRTMAVFLPLIALILFLIQIKKFPVKHTAKLYGIFALAFVLTSIALWPLLWENPIRYGLDAVFFSGNFAGVGFFFGKEYTEIPWFYIPVWIAITTPVIYSFFAAVGLLKTLRNIRRPTAEELFPLVWFFIPLIIIIVMKAGIYNDWRHVFFLYPAVLIFALQGIAWLWKQGHRTQYIVTILVVAGIASTAFRMIKSHPMQALYFSIPSKFVTGNFELDFWALSSRKALEIITKQDDAPILGISASNAITYFNAYTYFPDRMMYEAPTNDQVDYVIDTSSDQQVKELLPADALIGEVVVSGNVVARVYKSMSYKVSPQNQWEEERAGIQAREKPEWTYGSWKR